MGLLGDLLDLGLGLAEVAVDGLLNSSSSSSTKTDELKPFNTKITDEESFYKFLNKWADIFQRDKLFAKAKVEENKMPIIADCRKNITDVYEYFESAKASWFDPSSYNYNATQASFLMKHSIEKSKMEIDSVVYPCIAINIISDNTSLYFGKCPSKIKMDYDDVYRCEKLIRYYYGKNNYLEFRLRNVQHYSGLMYELLLSQYHNDVNTGACMSAVWKTTKNQKHFITEKNFFELLMDKDNTIYDDYTNFFETGLGKLEEKKKKEEEKKRKKEEQEQRKLELELEREKALEKALEEQARNDALSALDDI